jgi:hypothetical protein
VGAWTRCPTDQIAQQHRCRRNADAFGRERSRVLTAPTCHAGTAANGWAAADEDALAARQGDGKRLPVRPAKARRMCEPGGVNRR